MKLNTSEGQNSDSLAQATRCLRCAGLGSEYVNTSPKGGIKSSIDEFYSLLKKYNVEIDNRYSLG